MKILFVVGNNLQENTSANISHNAYIKGLLENGNSVDIIMKSSKNISIDKNMERFNTQYYEISGVGLLARFISLYKSKIEHRSDYSSINEIKKETFNTNKQMKKRKSFYSLIYSLIRKLCRTFYYLYISIIGGAYENHIYWIKHASKLRLNKKYDLVISNSTPNSAHEVVRLLLKKNRIHTDHWIQIWEDPWYYDLYGKKSNKVKKAEYKLLDAAEIIYYVSPLTLINQKKFFPKVSNKMNVIPLPCMDNVERKKEYKYECGYFGDYHSNVRNIMPFYMACRKKNISTVIFGNSDLELESTSNIKVHGRVALDILNKYQEENNILIHISNLKGGQIPGKIYHYSNTNHPILVILDGQDEEKQEIFNYFDKYNRFYFCDNNEISIINALEEIKKGNKSISNKPVKDFFPREVAKQLISSILKEESI